MAQRQWRSDDTDKWKYGFGDGSAGTSYAVPANEGCSGTSGTKSLTLAAAGSFANGDLVLIHQSRGTGVGAWELNKIASGAGGTSLTMVHDLMNTYADSGASQAQIIELNQYENLTTGSITGPSWDGSKGGIVAFLDKGTTTVNGNLYIKGVAGIGPYVNTELIAGATGGGFYGGNGDSEGVSISNATSGEGTVGARVNAANPNGSGGGQTEARAGGGGNGAVGGASDTAAGGLASGAASLVTMTFGGGGAGGSGLWTDTSAGSGGSGGGAVFIFSKNLVITGTVDVSGGAGGAGGSTNDGQSGGGGGAGGSVLIKSETATLGTNKILATGGAGGTSSSGRAGGAGAVGRIHLDYSISYTGTTNPTIDVTLDTTIRQTIAGGGFLFNLV